MVGLGEDATALNQTSARRRGTEERGQHPEIAPVLKKSRLGTQHSLRATENYLPWDLSEPIARWSRPDEP